MKRLFLLVAFLLITASVITGVIILSADSHESKFLSYEKYFKEERGFHHQGFNPKFDDFHVFIYTEDGWYWETDGLTPGYLYARDLNTKEFALLADEYVSCYWLVNDRIYYSAKDTIYSLDSTGKDRKAEFTAHGDISKFVVNDILI